MNIPKVSQEVDGILKFQLVHKSSPHPALFYQKMTLNSCHNAGKKANIS